MPTIATPCVIYRGINPPPIGGTGTLWLSQSVKTLQFSDSPADRNIILTAATGGFESNIAQEPSLFWNPVRKVWGCLYAGSASIGYMENAVAPNVTASWVRLTSTGTVNSTTAPTAVLGNGVGGQANNALHGRIYIEGNTIYYTFYDPTASVYKVAQSTMAAPWSFGSVAQIMSPPGQSAGGGNSKILPLVVGSSYLLFYEMNFSGANFQIGIASGTSPSGTFTPISQASPTLWANDTGDSTTGIGGCLTGGPLPFLENGVYVVYYHMGGQGVPSTDIYRAFSYDGINYTVDNGNYPVVRRRLPQESSQVADFSLALGPNEGYWGAWTAYDNATSVSYIVCSPAHEPLMRFDTSTWQPVRKTPGIQPSDLGFGIPLWVFSGTHTLANLEDATFNTTTTATLPAADVGAHCRVNCSSGTVTVAPNGADTIPLSGGNSVAAGATKTYRCYVQGIWQVGG